MEQDELLPSAQVSTRVMGLRLLTGLVQGALLYWIYRSAQQGGWLASTPAVMAPLLMAGLLLPAMLISAMGYMAPKKLGLWMLLAAGAVLAIALHAVQRDAGLQLPSGPGGNPAWRVLAGPVLPCGAVFLFIAHTLVLAGALDQRRIASYDRYFDLSWKLVVQLLFSAVFVGALWLVLLMGSGLFAMVKLDFFKKMLTEAWFNVPVICFAWSCAMHITDVRPAIVHGIRSLLLVLLSWLLLVAAVIITGFLCTLPFTGLDALWSTGHATALLLAADAVLIVLINAAFQNGHVKAALAVRVSARVAALLILPLTAIAVYALGLRVHDYGWTSDRVIAAAALVVASCYAFGYAWAAQRYESWLVPIAIVNVATSMVVLAVLMALLTPIADPARLSVNNQMARLAKGKTKPALFDFHYLRFEGQRYGQQALEQLAQQSSGPEAPWIREQASKALKEVQPWAPARPGTLVSVRDNLTLWPQGARLPDSFAAQRWQGRDGSVPGCLTMAGMKCDALILDMDGDGQPEVLLFSGAGYPGPALYRRDSDGEWSLHGRLALQGSACPALVERLKLGQFQLVAPPIRALQLGAQVLQFQSAFDQDDCRALTPASAAAQASASAPVAVPAAPSR
ncbi:DUF4153 domain-containing protein [Pseudoduganella danionis]|uniref:DUF4153 domain-containing protein n=1 Tax=Pseudoduganella danionis TaxID=1890295 RepID=A0ABW9SSI4_9BURK|nr:DUF4153 domain-containing protein [Pseudoduganella danionis]MTW33669.1 DUF4153 domain-containing protein [Pseudoduganella danionis]